MSNLQKSLLIVGITLLANAAQADDDCTVPMDRWQPKSAVQAIVDGQGWTDARIKVDDGCYEVKARDQTGKRIEAKLDPATLQIVEMDRDGDDSDHDGKDAAKRGGAKAMGAGDSPLAPILPANPLVGKPTATLN